MRCLTGGGPSILRHVDSSVLAIAPPPALPRGHSAGCFRCAASLGWKQQGYRFTRRLLLPASGYQGPHRCHEPCDAAGGRRRWPPRGGRRELGGRCVRVVGGGGGRGTMGGKCQLFFPGKELWDEDAASRSSSRVLGVLHTEV